MKLLSDCRLILFDSKALALAYEHLKKMGESGLEGVALLVGTINGIKAQVTEAIIPIHKSDNLEGGLFYVIGKSELKRISKYLLTKELIPIAQIHSHPQEAYHSELDDRYPIVSEIGSISIVVPNFASGPMVYTDWAYFRLVGELEWYELSRREILNYIQINGTF